MTETPPAKPADRRDRRVYVWWGAGLGLLLGLGLVCWLVVIPVLQVREALKRYSGIYDELPVDNPQEIERLGGPKEALRKLSLYLRLPRRMADHRALAARMVSWCGQVAVPEAIRLLDDQDDGVRSEAASAVGWPGDSRGLEALVKALGDKHVRLNATVALARIGDARAVPPLAALLGDRDDTVRRYAAAALGSMGKPAVEPLAASSGDKDEWVRQAVAWSLGKIRSPQSVQPLTALVKDRSSLVRVAAAWALGEIGPQANQAIPELGEALHDQDAGVRSAAAEALKKIQGEGPALELARKAKAALLALMRAQPGLFEGADPERFERVELKPGADGRFTWGAFTIDTAKRTYSATVESEAAFWAYQGKFTVAPSGEWKAENLGKQHATAGPPQRP